MEKKRRTKIVDLLKSTAYGSIVDVKGWVRTHRSSKAVDSLLSMMALQSRIYKSWLIPPRSTTTC